MSAPPDCPCGSGQHYAACCGRFLDAGLWPETAAELMRSRYTAFTQGREDYLLATWHPTTRPRGLGLGEAGAVRWLGLDVRRTSAGGPGEATGTVEFVARFKRGGRAERLHEVSRFVREGGRWYYVDGEPGGQTACR